jgi:hypothetical protein
LASSASANSAGSFAEPLIRSMAVRASSDQRLRNSAFCCGGIGYISSCASWLMFVRAVARFSVATRRASRLELIR